MTNTIDQSLVSLRTSIKEYIEAAYHISDTALVRQRRELLDEVGVICQKPFIESTPRYRDGDRFAKIPGLPSIVRELLEALSQPDEAGKRLFYDPPRKHQAQALESALVKGNNLLIMTGTGSGKTESFLLPILGKLANEAASNPAAFKRQDAMRALILYPMNALVNDQLGRLRLIFGNPRMRGLFERLAGRPARFARYTSRTPYAGVRDKDKDRTRLQSIDDFYLAILRERESEDEERKQKAETLWAQLNGRGKWPAKVDIAAWYGAPSSRWTDRQGRFKRAVMMDGDAEAITRHEVFDFVPDLMVTNYSMLEYMLMRPIEREIFDRTRAWLHENPTEKFLVVLDEAHLYRGAGGTEVALLIRRLRERLDIDEARLSVICATASFSEKKSACEFASDLTGASVESFDPIEGDIAWAIPAEEGGTDDATRLAAVDLGSIYSDQPEIRYSAIKPLLDARQVPPTGHWAADLFQALREYPPLGLLINKTMKQAWSLDELGAAIFPDVPADQGNEAVHKLMALASAARPDLEKPSLFPSRAHSFFRGLPGLWLCMDPNCDQVAPDLRSGVGGKLYGQPIDLCKCGSIVLPLFTCRLCGTAYARAYATSSSDPGMIWSEPGGIVKASGIEIESLVPIDLLLQDAEPAGNSEPADLDLLSGRLGPTVESDKQRKVWMRRSSISGRQAQAETEDEDEQSVPMTAGRLYQPCGVCNKSGQRGSGIQDHETKGDEPFQALVSKQLQIQPPGPDRETRFAPLRGRKVLAFSDSRQVAARLAPKLQNFSARDAMRPLMVYGWKRLSELTTIDLRLTDIFFAVLVAANRLKVRLRPEISPGESFNIDRIVRQAVEAGAWDNDATLVRLREQVQQERLPISFVGQVLGAMQDRLAGLSALAIGSIIEHADSRDTVERLPGISRIATTPEQKQALARTWLRCWHAHGFISQNIPPNFQFEERHGFRIKGHAGKFTAMGRVLPDVGSKREFTSKWLPTLLETFTDRQIGELRILRANTLSLKLFGDWARCNSCKSVQRPFPGLAFCIDCNRGQLVPMDPDADAAFVARKGFYRRPIMGLMHDATMLPFSFVAAEHTAQLSSAQTESIFSKAEENELLFQDIQISLPSQRVESTAIDVLSSTTTMEVGIDIGSLSGVALRNMPPGRANYQQRAGRAGRRGNAIATVIAYGGTDTHDEHYFTKPELMIRGPVPDPVLTLDNASITQRHIRAFLLQNYHQARTTGVPPSSLPPNLFSVLDTVERFSTAGNIINRDDFHSWLVENEQSLRRRLDGWLPHKLEVTARSQLLANFVADCMDAVDKAIRFEPAGDARPPVQTPRPAREGVAPDDDEAGTAIEVQAETGEERAPQRSVGDNLLERLLYEGVLPRYAFPTNVASFYVFNRDRSTGVRPVFEFAPSQSLPVALSQYAPGKLIWISGACYTSQAIYSPIPQDKKRMWAAKRLYVECTNCGHAYTKEEGKGIALGESLPCDACGRPDTLGPARYWIEPVGFAHPITEPPETSPEDVPETTYATRAKLTMPTPPEESRWDVLQERVKALTESTHLLVSNTGPKEEGYTYCRSCGRIESSVTAEHSLRVRHEKPYADRTPECPGHSEHHHVILGTDFPTDIALFSFTVEEPVRLPPGDTPTDVALRTVSEALARQACLSLGIEFNELMAEFRPALNAAGVDGREVEVFLYDTLSGGAGFSKRVPSLGTKLLQSTLSLLNACPAGCDSSCYRCLRNFRNRLDHSILDRQLGAWFLEHVLTGTMPEFDAKRLRLAEKRLFEDLKRQKRSDITLKRGVDVRIGSETVLAPILIERRGVTKVVAISVPLADEVCAEASLRSAQALNPEQFIVVSELLARSNLAKATEKVLSELP